MEVAASQAVSERSLAESALKALKNFPEKEFAKAKGGGIGELMALLSDAKACQSIQDAIIVEETFAVLPKALRDKAAEVNEIETRLQGLKDLMAVHIDTIASHIQEHMSQDMLLGKKQPALQFDVATACQSYLSLLVKLKAGFGRRMYGLLFPNIIVH